MHIELNPLLLLIFTFSLLSTLPHHTIPYFTPSYLLYYLLCPTLSYPLLHYSLQVLLFVVDGAGGDGGESGGNNPASDLRCLWKELKLYDEALLTKPKLLFINKSDLECKNVLYYGYVLRNILFYNHKISLNLKRTIPSFLQIYFFNLQFIFCPL